MRPIEVVELSGDARTRGNVFGEKRRREIQDWLSAWLNDLRKAGIHDPQAYLASMLRDTDFLASIREHAPDLLHEVHAIAEGAQQPSELILAAQLMDEEWAYRLRCQVQQKPIEKCSSVAIAAEGGPTWIGQNMDLGSYTDGHQVLLRMAPHDATPGALIFTIGGMIALMGVNDRGLGVCVNSLRQLPAAQRGLPVAFMIRRLLQAQDATEAAELVCALPHATAQHYLLADARSIRSFEASPDGVAEYRSSNPARVLHTNHPLTAAYAQAAPGKQQDDSAARLRALVQRLGDGTPDLDALKSALSSCEDPEHPVCKPLPNYNLIDTEPGPMSFTTGSMISEFRADARAVESWVSAGPPSVRGYTHVRLAIYGST